MEEQKGYWFDPLFEAMQGFFQQLSDGECSKDNWVRVANNFCDIAKSCGRMSNTQATQQLAARLIDLLAESFYPIIDPEKVVECWKYFCILSDSHKSPDIFSILQCLKCY